MASVGIDSYLADMTDDGRELADRFLEMYYNARQKNLTWGNTRWMGVKTLRCPLDLWLYQEIIFESRPDLIVETGTAEGGGALFLASMCDLVQRGQVISIDIQHRANLSSHPRLTYLTGSSTARETVETVKGRAAQGQTLVILDSDHSRAHVLAELQAYASVIRCSVFALAASWAFVHTGWMSDVADCLA